MLPALFGKPAPDARFLSSELAGVVNGPVLVVMPDGFGLAAKGAALSLSALRKVATGSGADGLAAGAIAAIKLLAAAAGHHLTVSSSSADASLAASPSTVRHAMTAILVLAVLAAAAMAGALVLRLR